MFSSSGNIGHIPVDGVQVSELYEGAGAAGAVTYLVSEVTIEG